MRFLPVFLDLQAGPVLLVGGGELARAKLRLLVSAQARVRWYATDGGRDLAIRPLHACAFRAGQLRAPPWRPH